MASELEISTALCTDMALEGLYFTFFYISCAHCFVFVKVGVKITLGSSSLTKIVTFTPYYMLVNQAKVDCISRYHSEPFCV